MRGDRGTKVLLALIAVGLLALTITQIGASPAVAESPSKQEVLSQLGVTEAATVSGPATLPLRWWLGYARQTGTTTGSEGTFCGTAVIVLNTTPNPVDMQIEWFSSGSGSVGYSSVTIPAHRMRGMWSDVNPRLTPMNQTGGSSGIGIFVGHATVHASDPRVIATAYLVCKGAVSGDSAVAAMTAIPTFAVGATMDYFQAGMPGTLTPPMVVPEVPE